MSMLDTHYTKDGSDHRLRFNNVTELYRYSEGLPEPGSFADNNADHRRRSRDTKDDLWFGTPDFEAAIALRKGGWAEGLAAANALTAKIVGLIGGSLPVPTVVYDYTGQWVDVARFLEGEPECFGSMMDSEQMRPSASGKVINIGVNWAISGSQRAGTIARRGAAIMAVAQLLERCGKSVNVDVLWSTNNARTGRFISICSLRRAGEAMSPDVLAFGMGHPSFLRRHMFSVMEQLPDAIAKDVGVGGGYGHPCDVANEYDIYMPHILAGFDKDEEIAAWVATTLRAQGIELKGDR